MNETTTTPRTTSMDLRRLPASFLWGLGIGIVGFIISFRTTSTSSVNGEVTACSSMDLAALAWATLCVVCALAGIGRYRLQRPVDRAATRLMMLAVTAVLGLLAVIHVLRGLGMIGGPC